MRILLTNDDGIFAPGLAALYGKLCDIGEVVVVAPACSQSGASHSITYKEPLICNKIDINGLFSGYSVQGSPADCVKLAVMQLCKEPFDLVVSGINHGANVGINVYYSGTVAAAMEAAFLRIPAVAMSVSWDEEMNFEAAAELGVRVLKKIMPTDVGEVVNINIPQLSNGEPKAVKAVPQSTEGFDESYTKLTDQRGQTVYQLQLGTHRDLEPTADTICLAQGYITVTSLAPGMTDHEKTKKLAEKLQRNYAGEQDG